MFSNLPKSPRSLVAPGAIEGVFRRRTIADEARLTCTPPALTLLPAMQTLTLTASLIAAAALAAPASPLPVIESLSVTPERIELDSPYAYAQLVATAHLENGATVDVTRLAEISSVDGGVATASDEGFVQASRPGRTDLRLAIGGHQLTVPVIAKPGVAGPFQPDYVRDVMPVTSRLGCNAGTCHGAKDGKNGFKLSLRGYDPLYDVRAFTDDLAGRRVNLAAPESSLLLLKAIGAVPHEGGAVTSADSDHYQILRDWIAAGAGLDLATPKVQRIEVFPVDPVVETIGSEQQFRVIAHYGGGASRDVTREAFVESGNTEVAEPVKGALARIVTLRRGEAPLLVRFEGRYAATTVTVMGDREGFTWTQPPANNEIDRLVAAKWERMKIEPSGLCDDYEFVRRVHLDLTGLPPTEEAARRFATDRRDTRLKRDELIDRLIGSEAFVDHWTNKWADLLMVNRKYLGGEGAKALRDWIREEVRNNTPYDEFVRKVITASGSNRSNPAAGYFKILRTPEDLMENSTHLFLATRFNCNKCHDHPFERWTQDQYYELAAYYAQVELKADPASRDKKIGGTAVEGAKALYEIVGDRRSGEIKHERTGVETPPSFPYPAGFDLAPAPDASRREQLAAWITAPDNRYFAASYVNRLWGYMLGTGIIEPLDDIRAGNPPSNPELLRWLEREFIDSGFDTRHLLQAICKSRTYQLSVETNRWNADDSVNFSHAKARRLPAEVLYDTIYASLGARPKIPGVPAGTRASQLPDVGVKLPDGFLDNTGRPVRESSCECERSSDLQLGPIMALVSGPTVGDAISDPGNVLPKLVDSHPDDRQLVDSLVMRLLARPAKPYEIDAALELLGNLRSEHAALVATRDRRQAELQPEIDQAEAARASAIASAERALEDYRGKVARREAELDAEHAAGVEAARAALAGAEASLPARFTEWARRGTTETQWHPVTTVGMRSSVGARLAQEGDGSIFADGNNGRGLYQILATTELDTVTGVRIEALPDDRLPKKGPGRAPNDGNFVLTEFEAHAAAIPDKGDWSVVGLWNFDTAGDPEGWGRANQLDVVVDGGSLRLTGKGTDPYLAVDVAAPAGAFVLEMRALYPGEGKSNAQLFWTTAAGGGDKTSELRSTRITVDRGPEFATYRFHFESDADLRMIRLDPLDTADSILIDALRLIRTAPRGFEKLTLANARADFSQGSYDVATAIDGKRDDQNNGWAIAPKMGVPHTATFEVAGAAAGHRLLRFDLDQQYRGNDWSLGRFRLSVTDSPQPLSFGLPDEIKALLAKSEPARTADETKRLETYFRDNDNELKLLKAKLADAEKPRQRDPELVRLEGALAEAERPIPVDPALARLRADVELSAQQLSQSRLTAAQDLAWALINTPEFLFNR